jgi:hypothetical protein
VAACDRLACDLSHQVIPSNRLGIAWPLVADPLALLQTVMANCAQVPFGAVRQAIQKTANGPLWLQLELVTSLASVTQGDRYLAPVRTVGRPGASSMPDLQQSSGLLYDDMGQLMRHGRAQAARMFHELLVDDNGAGRSLSRRSTEIPDHEAAFRQLYPPGMAVLVHEFVQPIFCLRMQISINGQGLLAEVISHRTA